MKKLLYFYMCLCIVSLNGIFYSSVSAVPLNGLIAEYLFTGNANDTSGNNLNGTVHGATLTEDRFTNPGMAYNFDGNDYIQVSDNTLLNPSTITLAQAGGMRRSKRGRGAA